MITPAQCLEARKLLKWSRDRLAARCGISISTLRNFENGRAVLQPNEHAALKRTLQKNGIEFTNGGKGRREVEEAEVSVSPESIQPGRCYLLKTGHVRRVIRLMPDGRIQFEHRMGHTVGSWKIGIQEGRSFAFMIKREVPCDWSPGDPEPGAD